MPAAEAPIDAKSWADAQPPWRFRQWPTPRYTGYGNGWSEEYGFSSEVELWRTGSLLDVSCSSLLFFSSLDLGPVQMASAWVFTTFGVTSEGGSSPCAASAERSPWSCIDRLRDVWVRTIVYVGWLLHSLFPFPSFLLYWLWQPRRSASKERDDVTARLHVMCPGPGNGHSI